MFHIHLLHPWILATALPLIAIMAVLLYRGFKLRQDARRSYGDEELLSKFSRAVTFRQEAPIAVAWITVAVLLAIVAAQPVSSNSAAKLPIGFHQGCRGD